MNIGNRYGPLESPPSGAASTPSREKKEATPARRVDDELEISPEMRGVLVRLQGEPQVDPQLKALLRTPMTERRASDVLQKVKFGFYRQPPVVKHIANALAEALSGPA